MAAVIERVTNGDSDEKRGEAALSSLRATRIKGPKASREDENARPRASEWQAENKREEVPPRPRWEHKATRFV
jgi:hypothetical protein